MINKQLDRITKSDIDALIANETPEGRTIDYKETLPGGTDEEKKEFLSDISSFANAAGGDIIFGISEKRDANNRPTGLPNAAIGIPSFNKDFETARLEGSIRDGIAPRVSGIRFSSIDGFPNGPVLVVRLPKSWAAPHMVTFKGHSRFYSRNSVGKYPLDVTEIRSAFALSETLAERIRSFRSERLGRIIAGETPVPLHAGALIVLHVLPISALNRGKNIDLAEVEKRSRETGPLYRGGGWNHHFNFDGFVLFNSWEGNAGCASYLQIFRNGVLEGVDAVLLAGRAGKTIPSRAFESELVSALGRFLELEQSLDIEPPIVVMVTLLGVKDYTIGLRDGGIRPDTLHPIEKGDLLLPDFLVESYGDDLPALFRPTFDSVWQASGLSHCMGYDPTGKWKG